MHVCMYVCLSACLSADLLFLSLRQSVRVRVCVCVVGSPVDHPHLLRRSRAGQHPLGRELRHGQRPRPKRGGRRRNAPAIHSSATTPDARPLLDATAPPAAPYWGRAKDRRQRRIRVAGSPLPRTQFDPGGIRRGRGVTAGSRSGLDLSRGGQ